MTVMIWLLIVIGAIVTGLVVGLAEPPAAARPAGRAARPVIRAAHDPAAHGRRPTLPEVASWGYQLQNLDIARAARSPFDLLVVDCNKDGTDDTAITPAELARLKTRPDGRRRLVVAYLSIGEAESYRTYWQPSWVRRRPDWLLGENPDWPENYAVCYWDSSWQRIMCGSPNSALDRIMAAGFDGVYLDKCDVYEDLRIHYKPAAGSRPDLEADMVAFVAAISAHAKARDPDFLVVMQNAETLLERPALRRVIDAAAREELLFGEDGPGRRNADADVTLARRRLDLLAAEGKPVLMVEYLDAPAKIAAASALARAAGYVLFVAPQNRDLARLVEQRVADG